MVDIYKYMFKAVAYLRVSTEEQSLDSQYTDVKKFTKTKDLTIVEDFESDEYKEKIKNAGHLGSKKQ